MRIVMMFVVMVSLCGCVTRATLISQDSQRYEVQVDQLARKLTTTIDGVLYTGTAVGDRAIGIGSAQSFGLHPTYATGMSVMTGSNGQALFVAENGDFIECAFNKNGMTIIGKCQSNKGRQFVLTTM